MKKIFSVLVGFALAVSVVARDNKEVPAFLQDISVTIKSAGSEGSGVLFSRKDDKGEWINFVWTAGHVVAGLRSTREVISPDGSTRTIVEFQDARIAKEIRENGRTVGRLELDAEVLRYSNADTGEDLALLRLRKHNYVQVSAEFYLDKEPPTLGTDLYHVGSLLGQMGANSMTSGIYSQYGRLIDKKIFDQTTVAAFPGSSGGGVFLRDGRYVGMLVRGAGETFNLIVPIRRLLTWADKAKVRWAIDASVPLPAEDSQSVEDVGHTFKASDKPADTSKKPTDVPKTLERRVN